MSTEMQQALDALRECRDEFTKLVELMERRDYAASNSNDLAILTFQCGPEQCAVWRQQGYVGPVLDHAEHILAKYAPQQEKAA
jgi:hypothetical protein